jgi:hypothetical protein
LATLLGYETIVLCGVDMVNSKYFFDSSRYSQKDVPIPRAGITNTNRAHETNDIERGVKMRLENVIYLLDEIILQPNGIELYVENDISALSPRIPVYEYK